MKSLYHLTHRLSKRQFLSEGFVTPTATDGFCLFGGSCFYDIMKKVRYFIGLPFVFIGCQLVNIGLMVMGFAKYARKWGLYGRDL